MTYDCQISIFRCSDKYILTGLISGLSSWKVSFPAFYNSGNQKWSHKKIIDLGNFIIQVSKITLVEWSW